MHRVLKITLVVIVLALCGTALLVQRHLDQKRQSTSPNELYEVVWKQIRAIRTGDSVSAYRQVSTSFQEKLNIESFADLARAENAGIARATRIEFGAVRHVGQHAQVPVYFFLPDGDVIPCIYSLVNEGNSWKIDGARMLKRWPAGRRLGGMRA